MFNGVLSTDSPSLSAKLVRVFNAQDLAHFSALYQLTCELGGLNERGVVRKPDVSHNPRPARITQICLDGDEVPARITIGAAMLSAADPSLAGNTPGKYYEELSICRLYWQGPHNRVVEGSSQKAKLVLLANLLDNVRHIHMRELTPGARIEEIELAEQVCAALHKHGFQNKLIEKLIHNDSQQKRLMYRNTDE